MGMPMFPGSIVYAGKKYGYIYFGGYGKAERCRGDCPRAWSG